MAKAITYKEVSKGRSDAEAGELWRTIGEISGAGHIPVSDEATIDITDLAQGKQEQIDKLIGTKKKEN